MKQIANHYLLVSGSSFKNCKNQVIDFFQRSELVRYDYISIDEQECSPGKNPAFTTLLNKRVEENRSILKKLVEDIETTGTHTIADLINLEQGYPSKVLHIVTHFLDGFIGIDTIFYNLIDDSHWLPKNTLNKINKYPRNYWIIHLNGYSCSPENAALVSCQARTVDKIAKSFFLPAGCD